MHDVRSLRATRAGGRGRTLVRLCLQVLDLLPVELRGNLAELRGLGALDALRHGARGVVRGGGQPHHKAVDAPYRLAQLAPLRLHLPRRARVVPEQVLHVQAVCSRPRVTALCCGHRCG